MSMMSDEARLLRSLLDLTSLNDDDTDESVRALAMRAAAGPVAAVCVYPRFVPLVRRVLAGCGADAVRVATVCNFPHGAADVAAAVAETAAAIAAGADEIDVVFPWRALLAGDGRSGAALVAACKAACGTHTLKVIIESGMLQQPALIRRACDIALASGADFLKTSTGKVAHNASPEAARLMLLAIRDSGLACGFKVAGGVRTQAQARVYLQLAADIMGAGFLQPATMRIGASALLDELQTVIAAG